jgi:hypothetical protein
MEKEANVNLAMELPPEKPAPGELGERIREAIDTRQHTPVGMVVSDQPLAPSIDPTVPVGMPIATADLPPTEPPATIPTVPFVPGVRETFVARDPGNVFCGDVPGLTGGFYKRRYL